MERSAGLCAIEIEKQSKKIKDRKRNAFDLFLLFWFLIFLNLNARSSFC